MKGQESTSRYFNEAGGNGPPAADNRLEQAAKES